MEDNRTKATLDALADLFLTGTAPAPRPRSGPAAAAKPSAAPPRSAAAVLDPLSGPRPMRMSPKLRAAALVEKPVQVSPPPLAAAPPRQPGAPVAPQPLRLRRPDPVEPAPEQFESADESQPIELHVEAVFLGNLPGFGGPWLTQYAHRLAQQRGPVAVLHVDEQQIDLDLVTSNKPPLPQDADADSDAEASLERWIVGTPKHALATLLERLLHRAPVAVATWLIRLPERLTPPLQEIAQNLPRWTVLCGADEVAVSSASRLLEQLSQQHATDLRRRIAVMIFGADEARSLQALDRLRAAGEEFLAAPIELAGWQKQMAPVNVVPLGSFPDTAVIWPATWQLIRAQMHLSAAEAQPSAKAMPETMPLTDEAPFETTAQDEQLVEDELSAFEAAQALASNEPPPRPVEAPEPPAAETSLDEPVPEELLEEEAPQEMELPEEPPQPAVAKPRPVAQAPRPAPPPAPASVGEPDLAAFLGGGGVALQARCPRHPQTQLLLDEDGAIHLLRRYVPANPKSILDEGLRAAVLDLIEARAWVRENLELLALTQRQCLFDADAEPVLHLFTSEAKLATALVGRLGQFVRLHLLQQVKVGRESTWFSTELN